MAERLHSKVGGSQATRKVLVLLVSLLLFLTQSSSKMGKFLADFRSNKLCHESLLAEQEDLEMDIKQNIAPLLNLVETIIVVQLILTLSRAGAK